MLPTSVINICVTPQSAVSVNTNLTWQQQEAGGTMHLSERPHKHTQTVSLHSHYKQQEKCTDELIARNIMSASLCVSVSFLGRETEMICLRCSLFCMILCRLVSMILRNTTVPEMCDLTHGLIKSSLLLPLFITFCDPHYFYPSGRFEFQPPGSTCTVLQM